MSLHSFVIGRLNFPGGFRVEPGHVRRGPRMSDLRRVVVPAKADQDFSGEFALVLRRHLDTPVFSFTGGTVKVATPFNRAAAPMI